MTENTETELLPGTPKEALELGKIATQLMREMPEVQWENTYFHYTSASGLQGIVENNCLHFSDTKFLNDGSERLWGLEVFKSVIDDLAPTSSERVNTFLQQMYNREMGFSDDFRSVVFCMSKQGNLLNQWRDYGKDVVPYCIEFDRAFLQQKHDAQFISSVRAIIYDHKVQRGAVSDLISRVFKVMAPLWDTLTDEELDKMALYASFEAGYLLEHFKHPAFEAEQEVRLRISYHALTSAGCQPKFRPTSLGLAPYFVWAPGAKLPIKSVRVGPSPHSDASVEALKLFLSENQINAEALVSAIPIRR